MSNQPSECVSGIVEGVVSRYGRDPGYMIQILREIQEMTDWISPEVVDCLQAALSVPRTRIEGVAGFYPFLHLQPRGRYRLLFSNNVTDRMQGSGELLERLCTNLWIEKGKVSEDGLVSADTTSCTGLCDQGPALLVNDRAIPALNEQRIDRICDLVRDQVPLSQWPAELFRMENNIRRKDLLLGGDVLPGTAIAAAKALIEASPDAAFSGLLPAGSNPGGSAVLIDEIKRSRLRGHGGASVLIAQKWEACRNAPLQTGQQRVLVCNGNESEPGTFKDRVLLAGYADLVFEGMTIAAMAIGANHGILHLRGEYAYLKPELEEALEDRRRQNLLGRDIGGLPGMAFDIEIHVGAGGYICGEETALLESLEGKRSTPRNRPPFPATNGYRDQPTVVCNVETYAAAAAIMVIGSDAYARIGTEQSSGTRIHSISGDCERPGVYEYPFGVSVEQMLVDCGARDPQAVQVGGASGMLLSAGEFSRIIGFEDVPTSGAFMVFDRSRDLFEVARNFIHFFANESCGFCTPCRVGTTLLTRLMDKLASGHGSPYDFAEIEKLNHLLLSTSNCGLGRSACNPILDTIAKFRPVYDQRLEHREFAPAFDLDSALALARQMTGRDDAEAYLTTRVASEGN
ncbi:MAG: NAD(P)H-dependent oxidoreductase subunit E [Betaproteobacteria bacterium]